RCLGSASPHIYCLAHYQLYILYGHFRTEGKIAVTLQPEAVHFKVQFRRNEYNPAFKGSFEGVSTQLKKRQPQLTVIISRCFYFACNLELTTKTTEKFRGYSNDTCDCI